MDVEYGGERLQLSGQRALFWPRRGTLLVADTHFGKASVFRRAGIPIPETIDAHDLKRLSSLIEQYNARRLVILGDFFHGAPSASGGFIALFDEWLERQRSVEIEVVTGNHDRHGGAGHWRERVLWHPDDWQDGPFLLKHAPPLRPTPLALCGHLHPVLRLSSASGDHARLPVFWFTPSYAVLPSFGAFTGGSVVKPMTGDRLFVVADDGVVALPPKRAEAARSQ